MCALTMVCAVCVCSAQAFHGAFENFLSWLRKTERKIQRDEPIKLEEEDLKGGLKHLKVRHDTYTLGQGWARDLKRVDCALVASMLMIFKVSEREWGVSYGV